MRGSGLGISAAESDRMTDHSPVGVPRRSAAILVPTVTHNDLLLSASVRTSGRLAQADAPGDDAPGDDDTADDDTAEEALDREAPAVAGCPAHPAVVVTTPPRMIAHPESRPLRLSI